MYKKPLLYLILFGSVLRMITACFLELGNDEVYYYTYALHLQSNYFDHPPGVALLIRIFTFNLALKEEVFIRMGAVVFAAAGTVLSFHIGKQLQNERTGWFAAILYNTSLYSSLIAGLFILPDSPQVVFWLLSLYGMLYIAKKSAAKIPVHLYVWIAFGIANGLCIMCKVHGIFLWGGFGLYAIFYDRRLFSNYGLYIALLITGFIISPLILWNFQNHFATWNYHSKRVQGTHFDKNSFLQTFFGQVFYNNPINVVLMITGTVSLFRTNFFRQHIHTLFLFCGIPIIAAVTAMSLFDPVLPHWSGPGFLSLSFAGAVYIERRFSLNRTGSLPLVLRCSAALILLLVVAGTLLINFYPGTIGSKNRNTYGQYDFTLDMYGWKKFSTDFNLWYKEEEKLHLLPPDVKFVCNKWFPAAHVDFYVANPMHSFVIGKGSLGDLHHFIWLNSYRSPLMPNEKALCIVPSNYPSDLLYNTALFRRVTLLNRFTQYRGNKVCRYFDVYMLEGFHAP